MWLSQRQSWSLLSLYVRCEWRLPEPVGLLNTKTPHSDHVGDESWCWLWSDECDVAVARRCSALVCSLGPSCCSPTRLSERPAGPFYSSTSLTFLFSHPYSLFLHIYISLSSEVGRSLILRLRLLPRGPEGGPLTQDPGLRDRLSQLKILDNLDESEHGRCTAQRRHQPDLETCMTKMDM